MLGKSSPRKEETNLAYHDSDLLTSSQSFVADSEPVKSPVKKKNKVRIFLWSKDLHVTGPTQKKSFYPKHGDTSPCCQVGELSHLFITISQTSI